MAQSITRRAAVGAVVASGVGAFAAPAMAQATPVRLGVTEWLGRDWRAERVRFEVGAPLAALAAQGFGVVDGTGRPVPVEVVGDQAVELLVDLPPFAHVDYEMRAGVAAARTDLRAETTADLIVLANDAVRIALRRRLAPGEAPFAGLDRGDGVWTGASRLASDVDPVAAYAATLERQGPVAASVLCRTRFASGLTWDLRVTLQASDPAAVIEEQWSDWRHPAWRLDFGDSFRPSQLYFRNGADADGAHLGQVALTALGGAPGETVFTLEPWLYWWIAARRGNWFAALSEGGGKPIAFATLRADLWLTEAEGLSRRRISPLTVVRTTDGFELTLPGEGTGRRWLLAALAPEAIDRGLVGQFIAPPPQQLVIRHGDFPLDRVNQIVLDWPRDGLPYKRLILTDEDIAHQRGAPVTPQAQAWAAQYEPSGHEIGDDRLNDLVSYYLSTGDPAFGRRFSQAAVPQMQTAVDLFLRQDAIVTFGFAPHWHRQLIYAAHIADFAFADGFVSQADQQRLRAQAAFIAEAVSRPDYWSPVRGLSANADMTTMARSYPVFQACLVADHPRAGAWLDQALGELTREVETWSDEGGGWVEAPHYALGGMDYILGAALCAKSRGRPALADHPRLRAILEWFAQITTPPDPRLSGQDLAGVRHLPPIGNTWLLEATGEFGLCAWLWRKSDPDLSARLQWMHRASGSPTTPYFGGAYPALAPYRSTLVGADLPARQPDYGTALFPLTGAMLRAHFGTARETSLLMIAGPNHGHYDDDSGSVTLWGKGRRIADDFGYTGFAPKSDHSMVDSADARRIMLLDEFRPGDDVDHVSGVSGGWRRQILFVKSADPLGPNYFVIRDQLDFAGGDWRLYCAGQVTLDGQRAVALGDEDVATDIALLADRPLATRLQTVSRTSGAGGPKSVLTTTQTAFVAAMPAGGAAVTAVVYPRLKTERPPKISHSQNGQVVRVTTAHGADTLFLADAPIAWRGEGVRFTGQVGAVLRRKDGVRRVLIRGDALAGG